MKRLLLLILSALILIFSGCKEMTPETPVDALENSTASETVATETVPTEAPKKKIALTFDDGPNERNTVRMLDILKKNNAKATFFVCGWRIEYNEDILKRMAQEGNDIGGHSWDHSDLTDLSKKEVRKQLKDTNDAIYEASGYKPHIMRMPFGAWNDTVKSVAEKLDLSLIHWSDDTEDWKSKNAKKIYRFIMKNAEEGDIVLSHDLYDATVEAMEKAIPALIEQGYELVTVSDLLTSDGGEMNPGEVYFYRDFD